MFLLKEKNCHSQMTNCWGRVRKRTTQQNPENPDELNRQSESTYVEQLRNELAINVLSSQQQMAFRSLVAPVYEYYIDSGVLTDNEIKRALEVAGGQE